jgi:hypothetical protein
MGVIVSLIDSSKGYNELEHQQQDLLLDRLDFNEQHCPAYLSLLYIQSALDKGAPTSSKLPIVDSPSAIHTTAATYIQRREHPSVLYLEFIRLFSSLSPVDSSLTSRDDDPNSITSQFHRSLMVAR